MTEQWNALMNTMKGVAGKKYMNPNLLSQHPPMLLLPLTPGLKECVIKKAPKSAGPKANVYKR